MCLKYKRNGECKECVDGYAVIYNYSLGSSECQEADPLCLEYKWGTCNECQSGYNVAWDYDVNNWICQEADPNCKTY